MGKKKTTKEFLKEIKEVHGDKYDYSLLKYKGALKDITIVCHKHGPFKQKANKHLIGQNCPKCNNEKQALGLDAFIEKASEVHKSKYDYSLVDYKKAHSKVKIICPEHGIFSQRPTNHISKGRGCPKCKGGVRLTTKEFLDRISKDKFSKYDLSKIEYINTTTKVKIICPTHGEKWVLPITIEKGYGCFECSRIDAGFFSKAEQDWLNRLKVPIRYRQKEINIGGNRFAVDGYNPKTNTVYEFLGDFWHGNPDVYDLKDINKCSKKTFEELYTKTFERIEKLKKSGYRIIYIWENDWREYED